MQTRYDLSLVAGTQEYSLDPATVGFNLIGVRDVTYYLATTITPTTNRRDLRPRSIHWVQQRPAPLAAPTGYALDGELLVLDTQPTSSQSGHKVRVNCWREPAALTAVTTTVLSNYWDRVLLMGALWLAMKDLGYLELAEAQKQEYVALINEAHDDFQLNAEDTGWRTDLVTDSPMETG
jgi:hypothetical protein